jgi:hypothetical protein
VILIADENVQRTVVEGLRQTGHTVISSQGVRIRRLPS